MLGEYFSTIKSYKDLARAINLFFLGIEFSDLIVLYYYAKTGKSAIDWFNRIKHEDFDKSSMYLKML